MTLIRLLGPALIVLAGPAAAQERPGPDACAGLAPDSFEAAVLRCGDAAAAPARPGGPPRTLAVLGPAPPRRPAGPAVVLRLGGADAPPAAAEGPATLRVIGELTAVETLSAPSPGAPSPAVASLGAPSAGAAPAEAAGPVPAARRPPPGTCRVWFPDRHPGLQRAPTPCEVEVPAGAVLIRG